MAVGGVGWGGGWRVGGGGGGGRVVVSSGRKGRPAFRELEWHPPQGFQRAPLSLSSCRQDFKIHTINILIYLFFTYCYFFTAWHWESLWHHAGSSNTLLGTWDPSSPMREPTCVPYIVRRILNHWTLREVPS